MSRSVRLVVASLGICAAVLAASAQTFTPQTILFNGDPEYTDQELLAASGIKKGEPLDNDSLRAHGQQLIDSGMFAKVSYKFNDQMLVFELSPSTELMAVHMDNIPLPSDTDLNEKLRAALPLFHGKVPADGGLKDEVSKVLEQLLAAEGLTASIQATVNMTQASGRVVIYSIMSPAVVIGEIRLTEKSTKLEPGAEDVVKHLLGSPYPASGSPSQISTYLGNYYRDKGYLEVAVDVTPHGKATAAADSIQVPFEITVAPGIRYKLSSVKLAPDMAITQADFDHQSNIHPGDIADGQHIIENWEYIARKYRDRGFMTARIRPEPTFDREKGTVSYVVTAEPGPVYTMGKLSIENVSDDLRAAMLSAWKMPAGSTFNEGCVRAYFATHDVNPVLERVFAAVNLSYNLTLQESDRTVDVVLRLEKKH